MPTIVACRMEALTLNGSFVTTVGSVGVVRAPSVHQAVEVSITDVKSIHSRIRFFAFTY